MTLENGIQLAGFLVGLVGTWQVVTQLFYGRQGKLRDEYNFANSFFADLQKNPQMHPFLREKGFQAIAGDAQLSGAEIEYLLTLQDSARALRNFVLGRPYLKFFVTVTGRQLKFKTEYENNWSRQWRKALYASLYLVCYSLGVAPLIAPAFNLLRPESSIIALSITIPLFFPAGFLALRAGVRIVRAEVLIKSQVKHAQSIVMALNRA